MPKRDPEIEQLTGVVVRKVVKRGTASEHDAVVLQTADGEDLILQRIGGNAFDDADTRALTGKHVRVEGFRLNDIFRYRAAETVGDQ